MKTTRALLVLFSAMAATIASAQVQFVFVEKQVQYTQNSASAPSVASGSPYVFKFAINGAGANSLAGYTTVQIFTTAFGSGVSGPLNATTYNPTEDNWEMTPLTYGSLGALDTAFANGLYAVKLNTTTQDVTLGGGLGPSYTDVFPAAAPMVTGLSAGNFDGLGQLKINLALNSYTFNLNGLAGYPSGGHVGIFLNGVNEPSFVSGNNPGGEVRAESIKLGTNNDPEVTFLTFNPSASNMVLGQTYTLEIEYNLALNTASNLFGGGAGELDLGLFTYRTQLTLIAVPEPSTYAAIFGGVALAGVMLHRRRRASA